MQLIQLLLLILVYVGAVALMYGKKLNTIIGLPILALLIAFIARVPGATILQEIITDGALRLHNPIIVIIFGASLAELVKRTGLIEVMIKNTAEFLGDRTFLIATFLMIVIAILFTVLAGLGAVVMVGSVVFPILLSLGISRMLAGCIFLMGLSLGGLLNLFNWDLYTDVLKLSQGDIFTFVLRYLPIVLAISIGFIWIELKREGGTSFKRAAAGSAGGPAKKAPTSLPFLLYFTPLIPIILLVVAKLGFGFDFPIIGAMFLGLLWGVAFAPKSSGDRSQLLTGSLVEGVSSVAPAIILMIGIGMLLKSVAQPKVAEILLPSLKSIMPGSGIGYIAFFTLLAPLALYRGPLNIFGMGSGLVVLMKDTGLMPAAAIMAALMAVGQVQGISDPTNTYNVWIANYLGIDVLKILRRTIVYAWIMALVGLILGATLYYR